MAAQGLMHENAQSEGIATATGFTDRAQSSTIISQRMGQPAARTARMTGDASAARVGARLGACPACTL